MFLSRRSNGIYYIFYENHNGKRTCKSTGTKIKKQAYSFLNNFSAVSENEKKINVSNITLKAFTQRYLKYSENYHTQKTTLTYRTTFNFMLKYLGDKNISGISNIELQEFIENRISSVSLHAGRKDLINIKASFNWAVQMKLIKSNPANKLNRIKMPEKQPIFFSKKEYEELMKVIKCQHMRDIIEIAVNTGMRQMEIITLRWNQINLLEKSLILNNQNHITKGKRIRTIPLNNNCCEVFKRLKLSAQNDLVFHFNSCQFKQDYIVKNFKKYVKLAKINPELKFHSLRHTFASWLVQSGVSIYHISKLLGHSQISTSEIYSHLRMKDLSTVVNLLD